MLASLLADKHNDNTGHTEEYSYDLNPVDSLRKLIIARNYNQFVESLSGVEGEEERFKLAYSASVRANAPLKQRIYMISSVITSNTLGWLSSLPGEEDFYDIGLQVGIAVIAHKRGASHPEAQSYIASRLGLIALEPISTQRIKLLTKLNLPVTRKEISTIGDVVLWALSVNQSRTKSPVTIESLEALSKWLTIASNISLLEKPSLLASCIGILFNCHPREIVEAQILPIFQKLYLRNSRSCLQIIRNLKDEAYSMNEAIPSWLLLSLGSDGLKPSLISENDELRKLAVEVVAKTNYWQHTINISSFLAGKPHKIKKDILNSIFNTRDTLPPNIVEELLKLLSQESNDDLRYILGKIVAKNQPSSLFELLQSEKRLLVRLSLLASLCHVTIKHFSNHVDYLANYKATEPAEIFLICLAFGQAGNKTVASNINSACFTEKTLKSLEKFEDLPLEKLTWILQFVSRSVARNIWKLLLQSLSRTLELRKALNFQKTTFACDALADCLEELSSSLDDSKLKQAILVAQCAIKTRMDLASLVKVSHILPFSSFNMWNFISKKKHYTNQNEIKLDGLLEISKTLNNFDAKLAFYRQFPECIPKMMEQSAGNEDSLEDYISIISELVLTRPQYIEPHLGKYHHLWSTNSPKHSRLLYSLLHCCSYPLGIFGPLFASMHFNLSNHSNLIDANWNVQADRCFSLIISHLDKGGLLHRGTFAFTFPILLQSIGRVLGEDDDLNTLLERIIPSHLNLIIEEGLIESCLEQLLEIVMSKPRFNRSAMNIGHLLCKSILKPPACLLRGIVNPDKLVRSVSLDLLKDIADLHILKEQYASILWILQKDNETATIIFKEILKLSSIPFESLLKLLDQNYGDWFDDLLVAGFYDFPLVSPHNHQAPLIQKYLELWNGRKPEIIDPRNRDADLTIEKRFLIIKILQTWFENTKLTLEVYIQQLDFALNHAFLDTFDKICEASLTGLLAATRNFDLNDKNIILERLRKHQAPGEKIRLYSIILQGGLMQGRVSDDERFLNTLELIFVQLFKSESNFRPLIAKELTPLFSQCSPAIQGKYVANLLHRLDNSMDVNELKGTAFALAALIKGIGPLAISLYGIMKKLILILETKDCPFLRKQGAIFCLDQLAQSMTLMFEPYIVAVVPLLLSTLADGRTEIRDALIAAAGSMMVCVSSVGANLIMPQLLQLLSSTSWRSKVGSLQWLGTMTNISPGALAKQLPTIIPKVTEALSDSHHAVQCAAREALLKYTLIARNPEIKSLAQFIMNALADPTKFSENFLDAILHTTFAHTIDGPSMALINPILVRVLANRTAGRTDSKKKAAQILANLATNLIDSRDLEYFLNDLIPALKSCLSDPVPEVRAHSARVIGILAGIVGDKSSIVEKLNVQLQEAIFSSDVSSVDRSGAAQGFAELMAARGLELIPGIVDELLLPTLSSQLSHQREGAVMLMGYLAASFDLQGTLADFYEEGFQKAIPPTILAIADEIDAIREAAKLSCHQLIARIARIDHVSLFDIILSLLNHHKWRCRLGALHLFQEFLGKFSTVVEQDEAASLAIPSAEDLIEGGINKERVDRLMAVVFLHRFDPSSTEIRHISLNIWKGLAIHPLRSLTAILPTLIDISCHIMKSSDTEQFSMVENAFMDMMSKIGDRVIIQFLEIIRAKYRQELELQALSLASHGIHPMFSGNSSISISPNVYKTILNESIEFIIEALESPTEQVRKGACDLLQTLMNQTPLVSDEAVVDKILDPMLDELLSDDVVDPITLDAMISLLSIKNQREFSSHALTRILKAWKDLENQTLILSMITITNALFKHLQGELSSFVVKYMEAIIAKSSLLEQGQLKEMLIELIKALEDDYDSPYQISLAQLLERYVSEGLSDAAFMIIGGYLSLDNVDAGRYINIWPLRIFSCINESAEARTCAISLLIHSGTNGLHTMDIADGIIKALTKYNRLSSSCAEVIGPLVKNLLIPSLLATDLLAEDEQNHRMIACELIQLLSRRISSETWGSNLVPLTGALIRTCSDRQRSDIQFCYEALRTLIDDHVLLLRPFYPQIQRLFILGLSSSSAPLILSSTEALIKLSNHLSRPESLLNNLLELCTSEDDAQLPALQVLSGSKLIPSNDALLTITQHCMSSKNKEIRKVCFDWIERLTKESIISNELQVKLSSLMALQ